MQIHYVHGYIYSLQYHIVWCVKYRRKVITEQIEKYLLEILTKIAQDNKFRILEFNTDKYYAHLLIDCSSQNYIPSILKALKGVM